MSRSAAIIRGFPSEEKVTLQGSGAQPVQTADAVLSAAFGHTIPTAQEICSLCSHREGFGLGCVLLHFMRTGRSHLPFGGCLDLSNFSLGAGKLGVLFSSLPSDISSLETLKCGRGVCTPSAVPVLASFLQRLKSGGPTGAASTSLKTLIATECELSDSVFFFQALPPSLESLDLRGNKFRSPSMEALGSILAARWLPSILSLDLSDNPLGPLGLRALAKGLSAPLQSLRLARTGAKEKGVEALAEVLKEKKVSSLNTLDLEGNEMGAGGFKHLAAGVCAEGAVPFLRVLLLKNNKLTYSETGEEERDYAPLTTLLSTDELKELEELDLSENVLFDERLGDDDGPNRVSAAAVVSAGRFPRLRALNLSSTRMSSEETVEFANALREGGAPLLEDLDLSGKSEAVEGWGEDDVGIQALANALSSGRLSHLKRLGLIHRYDFVVNALQSLFEAVADGKTPDLRAIETECAETGENYDEAMEAVVRAVGEGKVGKIENLVLDVFSGYLRAASVSSLGRALGSGGASSLRKLKLKWESPREDESPGGGMLGLVEGLVGGGVPLLEDLDLYVRCVGAEGGAELGEVLSTGKAPSLRRVSLGWPVSELLSALCEGLCVGSSPPPQMRMDLCLHVGSAPGSYNEAALIRLCETICSGRISFLRKLSTTFRALRQRTAEALGGALTHPGGSLASLEEVSVSPPTDHRVAEAFLRGMQGGAGRLPSLHTLSTSRVMAGEHAASLAALVTAGKVPSLREMKLNLQNAEFEGIQLLAMSLSPPHAASLRRVEVSFDYPTSCPIGPAKIATFCVSLTSAHLTKLQVLCVEGIKESGPGVLSLCAGLGSGKLSSLCELSLEKVCLESDAKALSKALNAQKLPSLRVLRLRYCSLTDNGLNALTDAWTNRPPPPLENLDLQGNELSDEGAESLVVFLASNRIPSLSKVNLLKNNTEDIDFRLRKVLPDVVEI
uniref:Uncharacterized protein n=1 Tax=Chromera velia CCMP2878 TaxID=1169474 RepID=A0A0G4FI74_9ALVE|eukprot:Cvel_17134.t1-p1 / transcript=Cvel_17134.t1 / gene=Cvel_17134 / organism=Chromera_velia_CCMP2878 / gene_product=Protein NLRC3, putative / transcript_product=Protein NLRC3, putative / location=Cvel_scaffold1352:20653-25917(-) / protein_length=957 / sequence_SO=supercontig / SO=protein_coding / is_pseudo=false